MAKLASKVVAQAQAWLGRKESNGTHETIIDIYNAHKPLARDYEVQYDDEWCATFVSAVAIKLGYTDIIPTECSCSKMIALLQNKGAWVENDAYKPSAGDIIFYDWDDRGSGENKAAPDHVGIVEKVSGNTITIIEGNYNCAVQRRYIAVNGRFIRGYGVPKYDKENASTGTTAAQTKKTVEEVAKEVLAGEWGNNPERKEALKAAGYDADAVQAKVNELSKKPATNTKTLETVAKEVLAGKWGNGKDRKIKLVAAGYDYNAVQEKVNELSKKSVTAIAKEVIVGKWGNGKDRVARLKAAGYDPDAVQAKVNELM